MKWVLAECDEKAAASLAVQAGLHPLIARLLVNRGVTDASSAGDFLACSLSKLSDPGIFCGMSNAVERIKRALSSSERIVVYGDYDVDGVTGASLLYLVLKTLTPQVGYYIPDRISEGYGLNAAALHNIKTSGAGLIITVDCGISAIKEADLARTIGLDLIITDHHDTPGLNHDLNSPDGSMLPDACAVLHPWHLLPGVSDGIRKQVGSLTGVGMAFKLAQALLGIDACDERMQSFLDLAALGTVADVGKIEGENRVLVKHGLDRLSLSENSLRPGIAALKQVSGLSGKKIGVGAVGFTLAPRINASGRLARADTAFRLMTTGSVEEAGTLAVVLDDVNRERQAVEERIQDEARRLCREFDLAATGAFVLESPEWHPGVIGIVAARIVEEFYRPTALISVKDGTGKGSARSIPGFDLHKGLMLCADLLLGYGGHKYAAGFTIAEDRIPEFRKRFSSIVIESIGKDGFLRIQLVDGSVEFSELTVDLLQEIEKLAPFGQGNPEPRLGARNLQVVQPRIVGSNHLKFRLRHHQGMILDAIAFKKGNLLGKQVRDGAVLAAVFTPRLNGWNGKTAVELEIRDVKIDK